jgi:hypothetical protein
VSVEWTQGIGPISVVATKGMPGTSLNPYPRRHSLGTIAPIPFQPRVIGAGDSVAWEKLREIPALLTSTDRAVTDFPRMTEAQMRTDGTQAGKLSMSQARTLEKNAYPERWRGPLPAFATFANQAHEFLTLGEAIILPDGTVLPSAGRVTTELALYLGAADSGRLAHLAVASDAFRDALVHAYQLAWLVKNLRQGHGDATRTVASTDNAGDFAWQYADESGEFPGLPPGWYRRHKATFVPGAEISRDVQLLQQSLVAELGVLRAELAANMVPGAPAPNPKFAPPTPRQRATGLLTAGLLLTAAGMVYWKWGPRPPRRRRGLDRITKTTRRAPEGARTMALLQ